jgi:hypothetical protein
MDRKHLVYDSLLSFQQQFMIDFNIYGMDMVEVSDARTPEHRITLADQDLICSIEHILNIDKVAQRPLGIKPDYKVIPSLEAIWQVRQYFNQLDISQGT